MISCILPTNRGGQWVTSRLQELADSTYENLEVIIIEDGPVESYDIPSKLNIKIIKMEHNSRSVSIPRAVGLSYATGDYISHIDDDVVVFKDKFDNLLKHIQDSWICYGDRIERYLPFTQKKSNIEHCD